MAFPIFPLQSASSQGKTVLIVRQVLQSLFNISTCFQPCQGPAKLFREVTLIVLVVFKPDQIHYLKIFNNNAIIATAIEGSLYA